MEDNNNNVNVLTVPNSTAANGSRWNPTKDQINLLENLYNQGIRTPTAEQIQQITSMLGAFGHIEGKNVFYWFQNHKARQRQKQKQENLAFFNHHFHYQYPPPPPPLYIQHFHPNLYYRPYYVPPPPQGDVGFYAKSPGFFLPAGATAGYKRKLPMVDKMQKTHCLEDQEEEINTANANQCCPETLDLFPLLPTGFSDDAPPPPSGSFEINFCGDSDSSGVDRTFFDFFRGNEAH